MRKILKVPKISIICYVPKRDHEENTIILRERWPKGDGIILPIRGVL